MNFRKIRSSSNKAIYVGFSFLLPFTKVLAKIRKKP